MKTALNVLRLLAYGILKLTLGIIEPILGYVYLLLLIGFIFVAVLMGGSEHQGKVLLLHVSVFIGLFGLQTLGHVFQRLLGQQQSNEH